MSAKAVRIRRATPADAAAIASIYNDAVLNSTATYDLEPETVEARRRWLAAQDRSGFPVLVAEEHGSVIGWGALGTFRAKPGFKHTAENSVYVVAGHRGSGVGTALLTELLAEARSLGLHVVVAAIDAESAASVRLHRALGFEPVGVFREVGRKFDRWLDVLFMQWIAPDVVSS